jgi:RecJ-like exonuclease
LFLDEIERIAKIIKSVIKQKNVKVISHNDCDGLISASIIAKMLLRENVNFELRIVKQLTSDVIKSLAVNETDFIIFTDLGSGQLHQLQSILDRTQVLILDHHEFVELKHLNLFHLNPLLFGEEVSSSVVCYLLAKSMNIKNVDLIDLAIVGAVADEHDEKWELKGLAKKILAEAETMGRISVEKGLRFYGRNTRPIHKSLAYTFDPFIPDISGSESNALQFLAELGIDVKQDGDWKKMRDLSLEEQRKLATAIILERLKIDHSDASDIFGDIYSLTGKPEDIQDTREFATLINACGRTGNQDVAIRICLGDLSVLNRSWDILEKYRKLISDGLNLLLENGSMVLSTSFGSYLLAGNRIPDTLIGAITSIILNSNLVDTNKPVFGFAETEGDKIKISARSPKNLKQISMRDVIVSATKAVGGEGGGHKHAAGGLVPKGKEDEFIKIVDNLLGEKFGS